jgi:peroxiredoxin
LGFKVANKLRKADSLTCAKESRAFRDSMSLLTGAGFV